MVTNDTPHSGQGDRLKVLLISKEFPHDSLTSEFGGGGSHVLYLAHGLARLGVEVLILTHPKATKSGSLLEYEDIKVITARFGDKALEGEALEKALEVCENERPDVIHAHHLGGVIGFFAATKVKCPLLLTMHKQPKDIMRDSSLKNRVKSRETYYSWRALWSDLIGAHVAYSKIYYQRLLEIGIPDEKIHLIPHGVPAQIMWEQSDKGSLKERHQEHIKERDTVIVCPLRPGKDGWQAFIEAAAIVNNRLGENHELRFVVTSKKPTPHMSRLANDLNLEVGKTLVFETFSMGDMWKLLRKARVCVAPSDRESKNIAVLEAMAVGTPVIVSAIPGIDEIVEDGISGLVFPLDRPDILAENIIEVLSSRYLVDHLTTQARALVESPFGSEVMAQQHLELYEQLAGRAVAQKQLGLVKQVKEHPVQDNSSQFAQGASIMKDVGVIIALRDEFRVFLPMVGKYTTDRRKGEVYYEFECQGAENKYPYRCVAAYIGEKGPSAAGITTERMIDAFSPRIVVIIGITAGIHDDVSLGDVLAVTEINNYREAGKQVPGQTPSDFEYELGGRVYRTDFAYINNCQHLEFEHPDAYTSWRQQCAEHISSQLKQFSSEIQKKLLEPKLFREQIEIFAEDVHLASGPDVGAAQSFTRWVRNHRDRNLLGLEMESGGFMADVWRRVEHQESLVLRGISDYGDERKGQLDKEYQGTFRGYAMHNATQLFLTLLRIGMLPHHSNRPA